MSFPTLILVFTISWRTALIFIVLLMELVHLYTASLKDMLKSLRFRLTRPQSDLNRLFLQILFICYTIQSPLEKYKIQAVFFCI